MGEICVPISRILLSPGLPDTTPWSCKGDRAMAELTAVITAEEPNELGVELGFSIGPLFVCADTVAR